MTRDERNKQNAEQVAEMLNVFGFDNDGFCDAMCRQHRTLQQNFTRLCIAWLATCASDDYRYDGRNEASHKIAVDIAQSYGAYHPGESFEDIEVPFI